MPRGKGKPIAIESYWFSNDETQVLIFTNSVRVWRRNTKGEFYVWDRKKRQLNPISDVTGLQQFAKFSPDGKSVAFVRDNNIFVAKLRSRREKQLTFDGDENIINGTGDWVYEEELGVRDGFEFSPDGKRIVFWRFDQTPIKPFYLIDQTSRPPNLLPVRYPLAGAQNSDVRIGVVEISSGKTAWVDLGPDKDIYVAALGFAGSSSEVWLTRLNRNQNKLDLMLADAKTGTSRVVMSDSDEAWVDVHVPHWIEGGARFLFESERDGYNQVFLLGRDGSLVRKVTTQEWDVFGIAGYDESRGLLYFTGAGEGPLVRPLYRVKLDGTGLTRISSANGTHVVSFNSDLSLYTDTYSSAGVPPVETLHDSDGEVVRTLSENRGAGENVRALSLNPPEFIKVPGADGSKLNAYVIRPPDFNPGRKYPVLMYVYGGPGSQTVRDSWGGGRYLWHQLMASEGYVVMSVDNRGTGGRGREFKKQTYMKLGKFEAADQVAVAKYLKSLSFVDPTRIGIWGWSYGGYMALMSMLTGERTFKTAIAVAPVTDWRFYDTIYTERYMRTPQENEQGYDLGAPLSYADELQGKLLIVHGTGDDNVHPQNTIRMILALEEANKQFDMRLYPNKTHAIAGGRTRVNLYQLFTDWIKENL
ncbi:MAG: S9 family peptidase [Gemmatimonadales bacterium]